MELLLVAPVLFALCLPGVAVGILALCFACFLAGGEATTVAAVVLTPLATAILIGTFLDRYAFGAVISTLGDKLALFAPIGSVIAAYLLLCSDTFVDALIASRHSGVAGIELVLLLLNDVVLISSFISLVLISICLLGELPIRWLKQGSLPNISLRLSSLRPLLLCFVLSATLHLINAVIEDEVFRGLRGMGVSPALQGGQGGIGG